MSNYFCNLLKTPSLVSKLSRCLSTRSHIDISAGLFQITDKYPAIFTKFNIDLSQISLEQLIQNVANALNNTIYVAGFPIKLTANQWSKFFTIGVIDTVWVVKDGVKVIVFIVSPEFMQELREHNIELHPYFAKQISEAVRFNVNIIPSFASKLMNHWHDLFIIRNFNSIEDINPGLDAGVYMIDEGTEGLIPINSIIEVSHNSYSLVPQTNSLTISTPLHISKSLLHTRSSTLRKLTRNPNIYPVLLKEEDLSHMKFEHIEVCGLQKGKGLKDNETMRVINTNAEVVKQSHTFNHSTFCSWDLETSDVNGVERPYGISWCLRHKRNFFTGWHYNLDMSKDNTLELILTMLTGIKAQLSSMGITQNRMYMYAHNGGTFDLPIVMKALLNIHNTPIKRELPDIISDRTRDIFQLTTKFDNITFTWRDSMKLIPISLANVAKNMLGENTQKISIDHNSLRLLVREGYSINSWDDRTKAIANGNDSLLSEYESPIKLVEAYTVRDSVIIAKSLIALSDVLKSQGYIFPIKHSITASSLGIYIFQKYLYDKVTTPLYSINMHTNLYSAHSKAYYGGRVEVFNSGINLDKVYHFDVPGLYANMIQKDLPIGNPVYVSKWHGTTEEFSTLLKEMPSQKLIGFFKCEVYCPTNLNYPVLPFKLGGKLTFPTGTFVGTWSRIELIKALEIGYTLTPQDGWIYKAGKPLAKYAKTFTDLKNKAGAEGNTSLKTTAKLLTNSLYGKFGSKYFMNTTTFADEDDLAQINALYKVNAVSQIDEKYILVSHQVLPKENSKADKDSINAAYKHSRKAMSDNDINMAIAATVTAYGRIDLYNLMTEVSNRGGVLCYTDTDSIFAWLPEDPFDKPFGPYTWVGPKDEHTLTKALFIAPKIYIYESLGGDKVFKVKGVKTSKGLQYRYDELAGLFLTKASVKFTDQTQFRHTSKSQELGVLIVNNLEKSYSLINSSKRDWVVESGGVAYTVPLCVDKTIIDSTKAIKQLSRSNPDIVKELVNELRKAKPLTPTKNNTVLQGDIYQKVSAINNSIRISFDFVKYDEVFTVAWTHALTTIAYNTDNINPDKVHNLKQAKILINDTNTNTFRTAAYFIGHDALGYTTHDVKEDLLNKILLLHAQYGQSIIWDKVEIVLNFANVPSLVEYSRDTNTAKTILDFQDAVKGLKTVVVAEEDLKKAEENLKDSKDKSETASKILREALARYDYIANNYFDLVKEYLWKNLPRQLSNRIALKNSKEVFQLNSKLQDDQIKSIIINHITKSFEHLIKEIYKVEYHPWVNNFVKSFKIENFEYNEILLRYSHAIIYCSLELLVEGGFINTLIKGGSKSKDEKGNWVSSPHIYKIADEYAHVINVLNVRSVLSKCSFFPVRYKYNPDSTHHTSSSKDKVEQLNKLGRTKIFLNKNYLKVLDTIDKILHRDKENFFKWIGITDRETQNSFIIEFYISYDLLNIITNITKILKQDYYYYRYFSDHRGRVYPIMTNISHVGPKWLRPLFSLENSRVKLSSQPSTLSKRSLPINIISEKSGYWYIVGKEQEINIDNTSSAKDILTQLEAKVTNKFDAQLLVRINEIKDIIENGETEITACFQWDMKNNAIQHASTIVGCEENMKSVGVLPSTEIVKDLYTKVGSHTLNCIASNSHIAQFKELVNTFNYTDDISKENSLKLLRSISKRSSIVIIYRARPRTMKNYVVDSLKENNIKLSKDSTNLLSEIIIDKALHILKEEYTLMRNIQNIVTTKSNGDVRWNFGELSDFKVKDSHKLIIQKDFKISFKGKTFHTSFNLKTNKPDWISLKNSLFVNQIHSIDSLHLQRVTKRIDNILTIHDAYLVPWNFKHTNLFNAVEEEFKIIHNNHKAFKPIVNRLAKRLGRHLRFDDFLLKNPHIIESGRIMS